MLTFSPFLALSLAFIEQRSLGPSHIAISLFAANCWFRSHGSSFDPGWHGIPGRSFSGGRLPAVHRRLGESHVGRGRGGGSCDIFGWPGWFHQNVSETLCDRNQICVGELSGESGVWDQEFRKGLCSVAGGVSNLWPEGPSHHSRQRQCGKEHHCKCLVGWWKVLAHCLLSHDLPHLWSTVQCFFHTRAYPKRNGPKERQLQTWGIISSSKCLPSKPVVEAWCDSSWPAWFGSKEGALEEPWGVHELSFGFIGCAFVRDWCEERHLRTGPFVFWKVDELSLEEPFAELGTLGEQVWHRRR